MKCPSCQADNLPDSRFCHKCATPFPEQPLSATKTIVTPFEELVRGLLFAERYEVIEELGRGGMGKVYKVFDKKINEVLALKLIKPEISFNTKAVERFKNELKFARKISHRHVCRLYDLGESGLTFYITMEYVEGEDLKHFIRRAGHINTAKALSIAKQVGEGLAEAHRLGIVHRDLKPQNIMIDREGNARIMDFGLARFVEAEGVTGSGVMLGTPEYMSPEQVELKEVDARSDIYSLGVIFYEMVTGSVPFSGETPLSVAIKHKTEKPPDSRALNPLVPETVSLMISKCLEKDRLRRFQSADELLSDLTDLDQSLPETVRDLSKSDQLKQKTAETRPKSHLKKMIWIGSAVIGLLVMILFAMQLVKVVGREFQKEYAPAMKSPPDSKRFSVLPMDKKSGPEPSPADEAGLAGVEILKFMSSKDHRSAQNLQKIVDGFKRYVPETGPYREAYDRTIDLIKEKEGQAKKPEEKIASAPATPVVQDDMQKLLALVAERQATQKAKEGMIAAKNQAMAKGNLEKDLIFRLSGYEETNAEEAFQKNDYSGSKVLFRVLEKIYALCSPGSSDRSCAETLRQYVAGLKKEIDQKDLAPADPWLYEYANETGKQAEEFVAKRDWENAGGALIRVAFLYEKLREAAVSRP